MVSGLPPFDGKDDKEILSKIQAINYTFDCTFLFEIRPIDETHFARTQRLDPQDSGTCLTTTDH